MTTSTDAWKGRTLSAIQSFGHRNWIVVADSAYPEHSNAGIETVLTGESLVRTLEWAIEAIRNVRHVRAVALIDSELAFLNDSECPGSEALRSAIGDAVKTVTVERLPHERIISRLDDAARLFKVLLLKTTETIPYSSVFLQLECGYWSAAQEAALRNRIEPPAGKWV